MEPQTASDVLMIRPAGFAANPETEASNLFQSRDRSLAAEQIQSEAIVEFDALLGALRGAGVSVIAFEDRPIPHTPDAVFPNNWVSFHADGTAVLYPMLSPVRRRERREEILAALSAQHGFRISRLVDLTAHERNGKFLEGTGSLVLDRVHRIAYACISPRTDLDVLGDFAQQLDYEIVAFDAHAQGAPVYHTNVVMCVGSRFAAVCSECIRADERDAVLESLRASGHAVLELSLEQLASFAGNMLELKTAQGGAVVAMSSRARDSLTPRQRDFLQEHAGSILAAPVPMIEAFGGGSVRCMLAEIHLPRK